MAKSPESSPRFDFDDKEPAVTSPDPTPETQPIQAPVAKPAKKIPAGFDPFGRENGKEDKRYL